MLDKDTGISFEKVLSISLPEDVTNSIFNTVDQKLCKWVVKGGKLILYAESMEER
jgi:hypothetical protein